MHVQKIMGITFSYSQLLSPTYTANTAIKQVNVHAVLVLSSSSSDSFAFSGLTLSFTSLDIDRLSIKLTVSNRTHLKGVNLNMLKKKVYYMG